jgi:ABC-type transport system involved in multi-copper enzyme maturation permease subunit
VSRPPRSPRWGAAIAGWELTRLARRGSPTIARLLVGLLLFAALLVTYLAAFPRDLNLIAQNKIQARLSSFGQDFALTLLLVQAAVVLLLTPLFVVGAIVEETERRTLEFLLATDLSAREIVLGKLWPRMLLMVGMVLVGWPVLAITQVWGGVDIVFVGVASLIVVAFIWAISGISAACAVGAKSLRKAMLKAYFYTVAALLVPLCDCPFVAIVFSAKPDSALTAFQGRSVGPTTPPTGFWDATVPRILAVAVPIIVHFLIGLWGVRRACNKLRHARYFYARMPWQEKPRKPQKWEQHPPVPQGSPLLWKEIHLSGQTARIVRLMNLVPTVVWLCLSSVFMMVGLVFALAIDQANNVLESMN